MTRRRDMKRLAEEAYRRVREKADDVLDRLDKRIDRLREEGRHRPGLEDELEAPEHPEHEER